MSQNTNLEEVRELYNRYAISWDENRSEELAACFTADGVFESGHGQFAGRDAILENMASLNRAMGRRKQRHVITNLSVHLEKDRGTGTAYFIDCVALDGKILVIAFGTYRDELRKADGRWCFSSRKSSVEGELAE